MSLAVRRLIAATVLGAILIAGQGLAPSAASADEGGSSRGLLGGLLDTVGGIVSETLDTTGLDAVVRVDVRSADDGLLQASVGVGSPDASLVDVDAQVGAGDGSVLNVGADVSVAQGALLEAAADAAVGDDHGLVHVSAGVEAVDGLLAGGAVEVDLLGDDAVLAVDATASVGDLVQVDAGIDVLGDAVLDASTHVAVGGGALLDVGLGAEVIGDSLLELDLNADVGGEAAVDVGVDVEVGGGDQPAPITETPPDASPDVSAPGANAGSVPGDAGGEDAPADATGVPVPAVPPLNTRTGHPEAAGVGITPAVPAPLGVDRSDGSEIAALSPATDSPSRVRTTPRPLAAAEDLVRTLNATLTAPAGGSFSVITSAATLAATAGLGAVLLWLMAHQPQFRRPASRVYLPPVPPG